MMMRSSVPPKQKQRRVCLFGLSGDPPTGTGGHVGIVQALSQHLSANAATNNNNEEEKAALIFDEIWVLPVYQHTYAVRA